MDTWDAKHHASTLQISYFNNCVHHKGNDTAALFGNHVVKPNEKYQWKIRIKTIFKRFNIYVGIVKNDNERISKHLDDNDGVLIIMDIGGK